MRTTVLYLVTYTFRVNSSGVSFNLQRKLTTQRLLKAIDSVASTLIKLMVTGPRTTEIKNDDGVMILKKQSAEELSTTSFSLPTDRGFDEGATDVHILPTTDANVTDSELSVYGIQASDAVMSFLAYVLVYMCGITMNSERIQESNPLDM